MEHGTILGIGVILLLGYYVWSENKRDRDVIFKALSDKEWLTVDQILQRTAGSGRKIETEMIHSALRAFEKRKLVEPGRSKDPRVVLLTNKGAWQHNSRYYRCDT